ncbi:hypothetical protein TRVA0_005S00892 [Trichomonascus vanleenenianus]|uniref:uncharacterized protein n=1 Tax=Trichomonascus vanleenenianus TaxID=2268995 RepID=UPI003ECA8EBC
MKVYYVIALLLAGYSTALPALDQESTALVRRKLVSDFSSHGASLDLDHSQFEKRRGGSGGGARGGGSSGSRGGSGSSSSSGSRGGSGSSGSSGSRGGSSSSANRGGAVTPLRPALPGGVYWGGAALPFAAGLTTGLGLVALVMLASSVHTHYPGYWGSNNAKVYDYPYNFTTSNGTQVFVDCYCMQNLPCSCEKENSTSYFEHLPSNISRFDRENDTAVHWYINGTLTGTVDKSTSTGGAGTLSPSNMLCVALATTVYYLL